MYSYRARQMPKCYASRNSLKRIILSITEFIKLQVMAEIMHHKIRLFIEFIREMNGKSDFQRHWSISFAGLFHQRVITNSILKSFQNTSKDRREEYTNCPFNLFI